MTKQIKDIVRSEGKDYRLFQCPLDDLIKKSGGLPPFDRISTACYRGYFALWALENDELKFCEIYDAWRNPWTEARNILFPKIGEQETRNNIVSKWFIGTLIIDIGSVKCGLLSKFMQKFEKIWIRKGKIIKREYFIRPDWMAFFHIFLIVLFFSILTYLGT